MTNPEALANAAKFAVAAPPIADPGGDLNATINRLITRHYFLVGVLQLTVAEKPPWELDARGGQRWRKLRIFAGFLPEQNRVRQRRPVCVFWGIRSIGEEQVSAIAARRWNCHLNLTNCGDTKSSMRRDVARLSTSN
jgi:hypothetical protein